MKNPSNYNSGQQYIWDSSLGVSLISSFSQRSKSHDSNSRKQILDLSWSPKGSLIACSLSDGTIRIWDAIEAKPLHTLKGHEDCVTCISWSPDGSLIASGSADTTIRIWTPNNGENVHILTGHSCPILDISWSPNNKMIATISQWTNKIRIWNVISGKRMLKISADHICSVNWSSIGHAIFAQRINKTIGLYDANHGQLIREYWSNSDHEYEYESEYNQIGFGKYSTWIPGHNIFVSGVNTKNINIWNTDTSKCLRMLEGHKYFINGVSLSYDGKFLVSIDLDNNICIWRCDSWEQDAYLSIDSFSYYDRRRIYYKPRNNQKSYRYDNHMFANELLTFHPNKLIIATTLPADDTVMIWKLDSDILLAGGPLYRTTHYVNAKVIILGNTGVGKSGLSLVLTGNSFHSTASTHAMHIYTFDIKEHSTNKDQTETRETLIWDLAGQPGYRVFHRQHLDQAAVALVLFDARSDTDPFAGVRYWSQALNDANLPVSVKKFLIAARIDVGRIPSSDDQILRLCDNYKLDDYFEVSAKEGIGIEELKIAIKDAIPWNDLTHVSTPEVFYNLKMFIVSEKKAGHILQRKSTLLERFLSTNPNFKATIVDLEICLENIERVGLVKRFSFGDFVLLQPELLDAYSAWLAQAAHAEPNGLGFISEENTRNGNFPMKKDRPLKDKSDEKLLLTATIEDLLGRGIALRQVTENGNMLVFPSELRTELRREKSQYLDVQQFSFRGSIRAIYATLAVCLTHSVGFTDVEFYNNAAVYKSVSDEVCGFRFEYIDITNDIEAKLTVFFGADTNRTTKLIFLRYISKQLSTLAYSNSIRSERVYQCECGFYIHPNTIEACRKHGRNSAFCPVCGTTQVIDDLAKMALQSDSEVEEQIQQSREELLRQQRLTVLHEHELRSEYHVFLCHNSKDKKEVRQLAKQLREYGIHSWMDEAGVIAGGQFVPSLERVIEKIPAAIIVVGAHWMGNWQKQEYYAFLQRFVEQRRENSFGSFQLIPVLLPSAKNEPELPQFLRSLNWIDFRKENGISNTQEMKSLVRAILGNRH